MTKHPKRARNPAQVAKLNLDIAPAPTTDCVNR